MAYQYDVFISYRRTSTTRQWLDDVFLQHFTDHLKEQTNNIGLKFFVDRDGIEGGDNWNDAIRNAAIRSKCLVAVLQPTYFQSEWCVRELAIFLNRHRKLGLGNAHKLVFPVTISDGEYFPEVLKAIQQFEAQKYNRPLASLRDTQRYLDFLDDLIDKWVPTIAKSLVLGSPPWNPDWLKDEWTEPSDLFKMLYQAPPSIMDPGYILSASTGDFSSQGHPIIMTAPTLT